jgi:hypothetical protein
MPDHGTGFIVICGASGVIGDIFPAIRTPDPVFRAPGYGGMSRPVLVGAFREEVKKKT